MLKTGIGVLLVGASVLPMGLLSANPARAQQGCTPSAINTCDDQLQLLLAGEEQAGEDFSTSSGNVRGLHVTVNGETIIGKDADTPAEHNEQAIDRQTIVGSVGHAALPHPTVSSAHKSAKPAPGLHNSHTQLPQKIDHKLLEAGLLDQRPMYRANRDDLLRNVKVDVAFDGLDGKKFLFVKTLPAKNIYVPGESLHFHAEWNYGHWIKSAELLIYKADAKNRNADSGLIATIPLDDARHAAWQIDPADFPTTGSLSYVLRVYDDKGRFDETRPIEVTVQPNDEVTTAGLTREERQLLNLHNNMLAVSGIAADGGVVTVRLRNIPLGLKPLVFKRNAPVSQGHGSVAQEILPPGDHIIDVVLEDEDGKHRLQFMQDINIPSSKWFYVGLADLTLGKRFGANSNALVAAEPGKFEPYYNKGRLAFYLKGQIKGDVLIKASLDTQEDDLENLLSNLDQKDARQLLRRIDPDDYYPVYGDDSTITEDAPTSGRFYVRLEKGDSHVMWGNFKVNVTGSELAGVQRGLYGAHGRLQSDERTSFGEPVMLVEGFAAQPGSVPQRDEFLGTGGSVYFLRRQDLRIGSEHIIVELRDSLTGLTIERKPLSADVDYTIDYVQGIVLLDAPLASAALSDDVISDGTSARYQQHLVVSYEYTPALSDNSGRSYGLRNQGWVFDTIRLGTTLYEEQSGPNYQRLLEYDLKMQLSQKSHFQLEWARSKGRAIARVTSTDGGFIFNPAGTDQYLPEAEAWHTKLLLDLAELSNNRIKGSFGAGYHVYESGFNGPGKTVPVGKNIFDAHLNVEMARDVTLKGKFHHIDRQDGVLDNAGTADLEFKLDKDYSARIGTGYSEKTADNAGNGDSGRRIDVGARLTRHFGDGGRTYLFGQKTIDRSPGRKLADRAGIGFERILNEQYSAEGEAFWSVDGPGLFAGLTYTDYDDRYFAGYKINPDAGQGDVSTYDPLGRDKGMFVFGLYRKLSPTSVAWSEHNFDLMGTEQGLTHAYGIDYMPEPAWKISLGLEAGTIRDEASGDFERYAPSLALSYSHEQASARARLETRFENSEDNKRDRTTWLAKLGGGFRFDEDWRFFVNMDAMFSQSDQTSLRDGDFIEASAGFVYRPVAHDRFNALLKYTLMQDLQDAVSTRARQRSHVFSADGIYDLNRHWSIGGKYGARLGEVAAAGSEDFADSQAHLGIVRLDYHLVKDWDIALEARALQLSELKQTQYGALAAIYRHMGDNFKIGVGYNFGRFSDDLTDLTLDDQGAFINLVGKF